MYRVYHSNSLKDLVKRYSNLFHTDSLFGERVITIVQNKNISNWLQLELTKVDGISMDLLVEYPENGVKLLVQGYKTGRELFTGADGKEKSLLFMDSLKIVLYKTLEEVLEDNSQYPDLYKYVDGSEQRLFQLSDSIAGLFYHYAMNCPGMVEAWDRGSLYSREGEEPLRVKEQLWQMSLWRKVFTPYLHISRVLNSVLSSGERYDPEISPLGKCRIILFGSSFLGESAIKFFNYLSRDIDVHHFLLTPSEIYTRESEEAPASLLNQFSGLIEGFTSLSREGDFIKERIIHYVPEKSETLLNRLKRGLWNNSLVDLSQSKKEVVFRDGSLIISKVTSGWREVEIVKDKILNLLEREPELRLTDIGVVAPDINEYASYVEAIFPHINYLEDGTREVGNKNLPYNIMGVNSGESSPYVRGLLSILDLINSDFNRSDIFNLLSNPCFCNSMNISQGEVNLFLESVEKLNIKWGVDGEHREELGYTSYNFNTWEEGFNRVLLGVALDPEDHIDIPVSFDDSQTVNSLGKLIHLIRSLYSDLSQIKSLKLFMDEWVLLIETLMESYLEPVKGDSLDERDRIAVKNQFRNILNLYDDLGELNNYENREIPYSVFKSLLKEFISKGTGNRGRYLTQGITFSSLKPLRAVPFKYIFVLGLNEDKFPGREKLPSYDLRSIYQQRIDLSKRQNDKFAFLEVLLSASKGVNLFYSSKNMVTGEELQPSVVINELLEAINLNFELEESLTESHPMHNFDENYFLKGSSLFSYNRRAYESALAYTSVKTLYKGADLGDEEIRRERIEVKISDLISFIKNPVKTFFTRGEGVFLEKSQVIEDDIFENRDLDPLYRWKFASLLINLGIAGDVDIKTQIDAFFSLAQREGAFLNSTLSTNVREDFFTLVEGINNSIEEYSLKKSGFTLEKRELNSEFSPIELSVDGIDLILTGDFENLWVNNRGEAFTCGVTLGSKKKREFRDRLLPYIYSLIIFNHPEMSENRVTSYCFGKEVLEPVVFNSGDMDGEKLKTLLSLYLKNLKNPIPLLPEIMNKLDPASDPVEVEQRWEKARNESLFLSEIRDCPYINMAYNSVPVIKKEWVEEFYNSVYREIGDE